MRKQKILVVDDEKLIRWSLSQKLSEWGFDVLEAESGKPALSIVKEDPPDLIMLDVKLPDTNGTDLLVEFKKILPDLPVVMITAFGVIHDAVTAMRRGAYDFITKPIDDTKLHNTIKHALETASLKREVAYYEQKEKTKFDLSQIIASSTKMQQVLEIVKKIATSEASIVLLQGESGVGKDLIAQTIHFLSRRKRGSYQIINCSAIPENLLESELFGYEKGAFTDARDKKKGLVELADEGTLFLDEISTLSIHLQAKLLRFLETKTFKRVGGLKDIDVDIRVIAATNQDLEVASNEGDFRKDLFYRLNVCPVLIPPLRERRKDIIPLAQHFIDQFNFSFKKNIKGLKKNSEDLFLEYDWPGNVRELRNAIERAMIFEEDSFITTKYLPILLNKNSFPLAKESSHKAGMGDLSLQEMEKMLLIKALKKSSGNKTRAATILKITRDTLRYKIKKLNIKPEDFAPST
ncbi:sigma-54-dependent transcriptional regulator [Acidobacteriota bacterium]